MKKHTADPPELVKNRKELYEAMMDDTGYLYCQRCQKTKCGMSFHVHHLVFRSEAPGHPMLHNKVNLIIVGDDCHMNAPDSFHTKKDSRIPFLKERGLYEIFEGYIAPEL